jgi:hypothetical protein
MTPSLAFRAFAAVLLATTVAACGSDDAVAPTPANPLPPLAAATWYVHTAEGQRLPALVAHRLEQGNLVQDFLDSALVQVTADGRWERRLWMSRYRAGRYEAALPSLEVGTWTATDTAYLFTAEPSGRRFALAALTPGEPATLPLRGTAEGYIEATVRTVRPEPSVVGTYRVTEVRGQPVPAALWVENDYEEDGQRYSVHLIVDSARLVLNGGYRYTHVIHYSEWFGPNNGPPTQRRYRAKTEDYGRWTRDDRLLRFTSNWLENHAFAGTTYDPRHMELLHGLSHGDMPVPVRYARP